MPKKLVEKTFREMRPGTVFKYFDCPERCLVGRLGRHPVSIRTSDGRVLYVNDEESLDSLYEVISEPRT